MIIFVVDEIERILSIGSFAEQYNATLDFIVTRRWWKSWDEGARMQLNIAIPKFSEILTRYRPQLKKEDVESKLYKWLS